MRDTIISTARAVIVGSLLVLAQAQAADYYVSPEGNDSSPGTSSEPFRTITYAYGVASAGTTIHVLPGVYTEYRSGWGIHLGKSGTGSSPIVLKSTVRGGAVIDGQNMSDRNVGFYIEGNYNTVEGFEIRDCPHGGITIWADHNRIINNEIHHNGNPSSDSPLGRDGIYSEEGTTGNYYGGNSIHDNGRPEDNNLDHGLYLCGKYETVVNNLLYRNSATGLQVAGYNTVAGMKVYNNVVAWNGKTGIILWQDLNGVDIRNNIVYQNGRAGIGCSTATGTGVVVDNNLVFGNSGGDYNWTGSGSTVSYTVGTTISSEPGFVNNTSPDFDARLRSDSPCLDTGLNLYSVLTTDWSGAYRPAGGAWNLGAHEGPGL